MDEIVKQAMAKWPNVPSVYGWLGLDRRGNWLIKGERISNRVIVEFINRNYEHDAEGRWYFQNGPQQVFVALDYTPYVYRLVYPHRGVTPRIESHNAKSITRVDAALIDEAGIVLLATEHGAGLVDDRDLDRLLPCFTDERGVALTEDTIAETIEALQGGGDARLYFHYLEYTVPVSPIKAGHVPVRFGFVQRPLAPSGQETC
jgi:hypothetical protein